MPTDGADVVHDERYNVLSTGGSVATGRAAVPLVHDSSTALANAVVEAVLQGTKGTGPGPTFDTGNRA